MSKEKQNGTRIYRVVGPDKAEHLVEAANQSQAIRHVVRSKYSASVASHSDLVRLLGAKVPVEQASADAE